MSTTSLLDDLFSRTVGKTSQGANLPADHASPGDILVNPQEFFTPKKSRYRDPQPEITIHSDDTEPEASPASQQHYTKEDHFGAFDYTSPANALPSTSHWTYANTGLGMSTLGIFTQQPSSSSAGNSPDLRTSFGASSSFMPGVGDVFDDYGLSAFVSPSLQQQPASADDSSNTILADLTSHPQTATEIQYGRRAAAAQAALQKSDPPAGPPPQPMTAFEPADFFAPGTNFLDSLSFDHSPGQAPIAHHQPHQQQKSAWSDPMPQQQWHANKSLRSVKSAGDLKARSKSQQHWPTFAFPSSYIPPGQPMPSTSRAAAPRRDVGPLDMPNLHTPTVPTLASPFMPQQPVSPSLSSHSPRPQQKKHFLDKDLTAHLASPKRATSSQGSTQSSSGTEWQQPMTPLTPRFDAALSPNPGGMYFMPPPLPMSPSQSSMPSPSQAQLRSPLNAIEGFANVNTDFLAYDPAVYNTSPTKPRRTLNRKRSRQDLEEDDFAPAQLPQVPTSDHGSEFEYHSESESAASDYADSDWAPQQFGSPSKTRAVPAANHTVRRVKSAPRLRQESRDFTGPAPQDILQSLPSDVFSEPQGGTSALPKTVIQSLYQNVPSAPGERGRRYQCLIEGCGRVFPRKSAIETHIQTHLEDKPFVCPDPDCDAAFVRQHDLRRHERIHSGNKPFNCPCGKGFARGDALTRHRQRGICIGSTVPRRQ